MMHAARRLKALLTDDRGQSLVLSTVAMTGMLGMGAVAIDMTSWYDKHHSAQVAADAASLAAANCLSTGSCATEGAATTVAISIAGSDGVTITASNVSYNTSNSTVTVTAPNPAPVFFASLLNFGSTVATSASSTATWHGNTGTYSLFAANPTCGTGLGLEMTSNGGGGESITGMHSNGTFIWQADSSSAVYGSYSSAQAGGTACTNDGWNFKQNGNILSSGTTDLPYPVTYVQPGTSGGPSCTYSQPWFSTSATGVNAIGGPGVYCVTATPSSCSQPTSSGGTGTIYIGTGLSGAYEFVGPCITLSTSGTVTAPSGAPVIYGTANTASSGTTDVWISGNGATLMAPIYDPSGTVEIQGNSGALFTGFVEAANIIVDKNSFSTFTGNGPTTAPGGDQLTS